MKHAVALFAVLVFLVVGPAAAQGDLAKLKPKDFPTQPVEFIVVYPAGGGMDVTARLLAKYVEKVSGDRILVNNRTGGAGMIGHSYLATQAKPDGYTVGVLANLVWGDAMLRAQGRWSLNDLEPIGYLNTFELYEGRRIRTVTVDPERAPHVHWAFEAYAGGNYSIVSLTDALNSRGLYASIHGKNPKPLAPSKSPRC